MQARRLTADGLPGLRTPPALLAALGLSPTTLRTWRDRAFERPGIRHRGEPFALALRAGRRG